MKNLVVLEEYVPFRPVRLPASPHAIPNRFTETTTVPCGVVRSFPSTALVHSPPIKTTPSQFGIDWTVKNPASKSHERTNVNLPAFLTTLIDWVFISAYSKYLVMELKVEIICKWSRFEAEWFRWRVWRWFDWLNSFCVVVQAQVFGTCCISWLMLFFRGTLEHHGNHRKFPVLLTLRLLADFSNASKEHRHIWHTTSIHTATVSPHGQHLGPHRFHLSAVLRWKPARNCLNPLA